MPFSSSLGNLFGRSPIKPLQEHMQVVRECAELLPAFFSAGSNGDWKQAEAVYQQIGELEHKADMQKKEIRLHLPRSLFMPIPRNDLLNMVTLQDRVANTTKDIAGLLLGRELAFPDSMKETTNRFVESALAVVAEADAVINELDELLETGFSGKELDIVDKLVTRLGEQESKSDGVEIQMRSQLRKLENDLPPIDVMFLYQVIDLIGNLADRAQKVGDQVHIIVAR